MFDTSVEIGDGSASSPALSFLAAPGTGFFRDGAGIGFAIGGVVVARLSAAGGLVQGNGPIQVTGATLAATANGASVVITTEALSTAAGSVFTYTLTNSAINVNSNVLVTVSYGTATAGVLVVQKVVPAAGSVAITVLNVGATSPAGAAINGTLKIGVLVQ